MNYHLSRFTLALSDYLPKIYLMRLISTQRVREQEDLFPILYATPEPLSSPEFPVHNTLLMGEERFL